MKRDNTSFQDPAQAFAPQSAAGGITGNTIDLQMYEAANTVLEVSQNGGGGDYSVKLQEAPDDGTGSAGSWTDVASSDLIGSFTSNIDGVSPGDFVEDVGYIGGSRFLRVVVTENSASSPGPDVAATVVRGFPRYGGGPADTSSAFPSAP